MENSSATTNIHQIEEADKLLENRIQGLIQILVGQVLVNGLQNHQDAVLLLEQINQEQTTGLYSYKNAEKLLRLLESKENLARLNRINLIEVFMLYKAAYHQFVEVSGNTKYIRKKRLNYNRVIVG